MIIPFTLLFGALGYLFYKSKEEVSLVDDLHSNNSSKDDDEDYYGDLDDLFI